MTSYSSSFCSNVAVDTSWSSSVFVGPFTTSVCLDSLVISSPEMDEADTKTDDAKNLECSKRSCKDAVTDVWIDFKIVDVMLGNEEKSALGLESMILLNSISSGEAFICVPCAPV